MYPRVTLIGVILLVLLTGARTAVAQAHAGEYERADIEQGFRLFGSLCAGCHGPNGDSVSTANLRAGQFRHAKSDADLQGVIRKGISGTPMPPHDTLTNAELIALVAFLRNMKDFDGGEVALGDKTRGRDLFEGKAQCATCHRVQGRGSRIAPDLSAVASVRSAAALERALLDSASTMLPVNRFVRAVKADGTVIRGRRLNEDTFTVQLMDDRERLVSLDKTTLREYVIEKTPPPSYKEKLSKQELADVLAYLVSLKGL